ncbi:hypothetical protein [uncultured Maricaulis sp.]|uniref:hypothetical protein n=1 Tax=uncultured Maricaulis sp. TaxID=174710 RepID=UPI00262FAD37|nr:hypothetical protein [uncultured Maricaulis sp.]
MRYVLITLFLAMSLGAPAWAQESRTDTRHALDFFLGVWRTEGGIPLEDGSWSRNSGVLTGERAFRGSDTPSVMVRTQSVPDSADTGSPFDIRYFEDITLYVLEPSSGEWRGISHNTLGNRKWRDVTISEGSVSFIQRGELFQVDQGEVRFTYSNITADRFEMRVDYRPDTESDWQIGTYRMTATRIG